MKNTTTLVLGASGATGKMLVQQLLEMNQNVKVIVRSPETIPENWSDNSRLTVIKASISQASVENMLGYVNDCDAVASCLGHNLTLKGIYGKPRKLVRDAVRLSCQALMALESDTAKKFVLMNTTGNRNRDLKEKISIGHRIVISLIRLLLPPQTDNEKAADYLRTEIGQTDPQVEWVAVRPDTLIDEKEVSPYTLHPSPTRSPIFKPGKTSRINVGHFIAKLIVDDALWDEWKGQMPVIYNEE